MAMRVRDIMSRPVHTVRAGDPVEAAAAVLAERRITAAPVVDDDGGLIGIVSEGDLLRDRVPPDPTAHLLGTAPQAGSRPRVVAEVMTRVVVTAWPAQDVADVARTMLDRDVRSVPVLDHGAVVGIVSRRDILRSVLRTDDVLCNEVQHRLDEYADGQRRWTVEVSDGVAMVGGVFTDESERAIVAVIARTVPGVSGVRLAGIGRAGRGEGVR
jgi:CBS domain-containing protein